MSEHRVLFPRHLEPPAPRGTDQLSRERKGASFDVKDLTVSLYGKDYLAQRDRILQILEQDPVLGDKSHRYYTGRDVRFAKSLESARRLVDLTKKHQWTNDDLLVADHLFDESGPFRLHRSMFMPTIANQGTPEQKRKFLEPAQRYEIIGCYAQTELGHGSNVRGLETTATYDPATQTFVIHSPSLTASKWWIGGLGVAATHAIVMARLVTQNKDYGPHPFVVQIRRLEDHQPLDGISVGDIGPKFGFNTVDNGFVLFNQVRVPYDSMLARYAHVEKATGEYRRPPNAKLAYGTMVFVRANIVLESRLVLARAATVAVRYSAVRAQGRSPDDPRPGETHVLDYTMQQYRLFPIIAQAYACHFTGQAMIRMYEENQSRMADGDFSYLADLHAASSGLKSLTTTLAVAAIEDCRRACGGHGYSLFSGLGQFYQDYLPKATWEGDNYLLMQQTARYLFKTFRAVRSGETPRQFSALYMADYLARPHQKCSIKDIQGWLDPGMLLSVLRYRAAFLIDCAVRKLDNKVAWNDLLVDIYRISRAHCQLVMATYFFDALPTLKGSTRAVLGRVAMLFATSMLEQELADVLMSGYVTSDQAMLLKDAVIVMLKQIRPDAVALVDAFDLPDYLMQSALGDYDGRAYERMTEMVEKEPINTTPVYEGYEAHIKPLIHAGRDRWTVYQGATARL